MSEVYYNWVVCKYSRGKYHFDCQTSSPMVAGYRHYKGASGQYSLAKLHCFYSHKLTYKHKWNQKLKPRNYRLCLIC